MIQNDHSCCNRAGYWQSQSSNCMVSQIRHTHVKGDILPPRQHIKISTRNNIRYRWSTVQSVATAVGCWHHKHSCTNLGPVTYLTVVWAQHPSSKNGNGLSLYWQLQQAHFGQSVPNCSCVPLAMQGVESYQVKGLTPGSSTFWAQFCNLLPSSITLMNKRWPMGIRCPPEFPLGTMSTCKWVMNSSFGFPKVEKNVPCCRCKNRRRLSTRMETF